MPARETPGHHTWTPECRVARDIAAKVAHVSAVSAGRIAPLKGTGQPPVCKIEQRGGCLLVKVRGRTSIQELRLYIEHGQFSVVEVALREAFSVLKWKVL
jgi:hypothetical protein